MRSRILLLAGLLALATGVGLISLAVANGQAHFALFLIVPVFYGASPLLALGSLLLIGGLLLVFLSPVWDGGAEEWEPAEPPVGSPLAASAATPVPPGGSKPRASYGGFLLIGPVPVVFGNRQGLMPYLVLLGVLMVVAIVLFLFLL